MKKKQFDPTKPARTKDGRPVRMLCTDLVYDNYPFVFAIMESNGEEEVASYTRNGVYHLDSNSLRDLINVPVKKIKWVTIYINDIDKLVIGGTYNTKEAAENNRHGGNDYITTIKVEWEE